MSLINLDLNKVPHPHIIAVTLLIFSSVFPPYHMLYELNRSAFNMEFLRVIFLCAAVGFSFNLMLMTIFIIENKISDEDVELPLLVIYTSMTNIAVVYLCYLVVWLGKDRTMSHLVELAGSGVFGMIVFSWIPAYIKTRKKKKASTS